MNMFGSTGKLEEDELARRLRLAELRKKNLLSLGMGGLLRETATGLTNEELRDQRDDFVDLSGMDVTIDDAPLPSPELESALVAQAIEKEAPSSRKDSTADNMRSTTSRPTPTGSRPIGVSDPRSQEAAKEPTPIVAESEQVVSAPVVSEPAQSDPGVMSQVADYLKENPDVAAAGLQSIGSLIANIGMARGQKKADEETQERTARANLIGAITGGRARPQVQAETPDAGFLGQLGSGLATAGKLGSDLIKQRNVMGLKEGELQRKIAADAVRAARVAAQNKMTDAQIEDLIARQTLAMTAEERKQFEAEVRRELELQKMEQRKLEFEESIRQWDDKSKARAFDQALRTRAADLAESYFDLSKEDKARAWKMQADQLNIQLEELGLKKDYYGLAKEELEFEKEEAQRKIDQQIKEMRAAQRRRTMELVDNLDAKQLNRFVDSQNGLFPTYNGLNAAYNDFLDNANSANMVAVFQMYQRLFDPATVREGDLRIQEEGQGLYLRLKSQYERALGEGSVLATDLIDQMKDVADRYIRSAREDANGRLDVYINQFVAGEGATEDELRQADALRAYYGSIFGDPMTQGGGTGGGRTGTAGAEFVSENYSDDE